MDTLEISAPSLEEAKAQAAERLGVAVSRLNVTVLEETKGLFGKAQVRVKAEVKPERASKAKPSQPETVSETAAVTIEEPAAKPKRGRKAAEAPPVEDEPAAVEEAKPARKGLFGKASEEAEEKPKSKAKAAKPAAKEAAPEEPKAKSAQAAKPAKNEDSDAADVVATQDDADQLSGYLDEILSASGLDAEAHVSGLNGRYVNIEVDGRDASYLVGRKGEVLNALQYLMNVVSNRRIGTGARVVLDADSYRGRREEVLTKLATDIAEQVRERGEEAVLDALPAFERRVIHKALAEMEGVTTYSEGEEPERRVVIAPAD